MTGLLVAALLIANFTLSYLLSGWYRRYALRRAVSDMRSSQVTPAIPVPGSGGFAFIIPLLGVSLVFSLFFEREALWLALLGGGGAVALLGWFGERYNLPLGVRLLVQGLIVAWALLWLGGLSEISLGSAALTLGWLGYPLAWLGVMGALNLYSLMDRVDGLAAGQGVLGAGVAGFLLLGQQPELALACLTLGSAVLGFLTWNWPPAKLAMGSAGSSFLGFTFALLALSSDANALPLLGWLTLFAVFLVDVAATLTARALQSDHKYEAYAYQKAARARFSERRVVTATLLLGAALSLVTITGTLRPPLLLPLALAAFTLLFVLWWAVSVKNVLRSLK